MIGKGEKFSAKNLEKSGKPKLVEKRAKEQLGREPESNEEEAAAFLAFLEDAQKDEKKVAAFKRMLHMKHIVRPEDVPVDSMPEEEQKEYIQDIQEKQRESLNHWIDYFASEESDDIPTWAKVWAFNGMIDMVRDERAHIYRKRTQETTQPFIDFDKTALLWLTGMVVEEVEGGVDTEKGVSHALKIALRTTDFTLLYRYALENKEDGERKWGIKFMSKKELAGRLADEEGAWRTEFSYLDDEPFAKNPESFVKGYAVASGRRDLDDRRRSREEPAGYYMRRYDIPQSYTDWQHKNILYPIYYLHGRLQAYVQVDASQEDKIAGWRKFIEDDLRKEFPITQTETTSSPYPPPSEKFNELLNTLESMLSKGQIPDEDFVEEILVEKFSGTPKDDNRDAYKYAVIFNDTGSDPSIYKDRTWRKSDWKKEDVVAIQCLLQNKGSEADLKDLKENFKKREGIDVAIYSANGEEL